MKRTLKASAVTAFVLATALPFVAEAKDWIESVSIAKDGIDVQTVDVTATGGKYTAIKTSNYRFGLRLNARATSGERIIAGIVGSYNGVQYFEGSHPNKWDVKMAGRNFGGTDARTIGLSIDPQLKLSKLTWQGKDPIKLCNELMAAQIKNGVSKAEVWSTTWTTKANVFFQLQAVAVKKNKAQSGKGGLKDATTERASLSYPVSVRGPAGN